MTNMPRSTGLACRATQQPAGHPPQADSSLFPCRLIIISVVLFVCQHFVCLRSVDENPKINKSFIISSQEQGAFPRQIAQNKSEISGSIQRATNDTHAYIYGDIYLYNTNMRGCVNNYNVQIAWYVSLSLCVCVCQCHLPHLLYCRSLGMLGWTLPPNHHPQSSSLADVLHVALLTSSTY